MPNWCYTTYKCIGNSKNISQLHGVLKYISRRKTSIVPNGFGKFWLGNLVTKLGGNWEDYPCRGEIIDYSLQDKNTLMIYQNTAWAEQEGVRRIIEERFPGVKVYYQEEEPGCEVYATNSFEHFPDRYYLDSFDEPMYFDDIRDASRFVSEIVGHEVEPNVESIIQALDDYLEEHDDEDTWYSFHEFEEIVD